MKKILNAKYSQKQGNVQTFLLIFIVLIIGGLIGGALFYLSTIKQQSQLPASTRIIYPPDATLPTFAPVIDAIKHSIVNIYTEQNIRGPSRRYHPFNDDLLNEFFGDDILRYFFGPSERGYKVTSLGSGVMVDPGGYILTNNHVIEKADSISVKLSDGTEYRNVQVVGKDPKTDLALIKISGKNKFPVAILGNSDDVKVGDWVLAIGNPFGFTETVSHGIISALGRHVGVAEYEDFIQTDAAINPGNSGGPLINLKGEVIGINTVIATPTQSNVGIGFAIPSNIAKNIFSELREHGKVVRGWIGVHLQEIPPELENRFGVKEGVRITRVFKDTPAEKAGIKVDDVIVTYDGKKITKIDQLRNLVSSTKVGKTVQIKLIRNKEPLTIKVVISQLPTDVSQVQPRQRNIDIGITVENVTETIAERLDLDKVAGVIVTRVSENSVAGEAGVQRGDVILEINNKTIDNIGDYEAVVNSLSEGDKIYLRIFRDGYIIYIIFNL